MASPYDSRSTTTGTGHPDADVSWLARVDQFLAARPGRRLGNCGGSAVADAPACPGNRS